MCHIDIFRAFYDLVEDVALWWRAVEKTTKRMAKNTSICLENLRPRREATVKFAEKRH